MKMVTFIIGLLIGYFFKDKINTLIKKVKEKVTL
jgi:hypothetical protein